MEQMKRWFNWPKRTGKTFAILMIVFGRINDVLKVMHVLNGVHNWLKMLNKRMKVEFKCTLPSISAPNDVQLWMLLTHVAYISVSYFATNVACKRKNSSSVYVDVWLFYDKNFIGNYVDGIAFHLENMNKNITHDFVNDCPFCQPIEVHWLDGFIWNLFIVLKRWAYLYLYRIFHCQTIGKTRQHSKLLL